MQICLNYQIIKKIQPKCFLEKKLKLKRNGLQSHFNGKFHKICQKGKKHGRKINVHNFNLCTFLAY